MCIVFVYWYVEQKKREADLVWKVNKEDLHFDSPPEVIGQGSFGLVLLAEYRGTQVSARFRRRKIRENMRVDLLSNLVSVYFFRWRLSGHTKTKRKP